MEKRTTRMQKQSPEKKHRIYQIAMEMFMTKGYENTTVRDICQAAGITNSSFYNFFGDKLSVLLYFDYEILKGNDHFLAPLDDNLKTPYQNVCDYFIHTTAYYDRIGKELAGQVLHSTPKLLNGKYDAMSRKNTTLRIAQYLLAAQEKGYIQADRDCTMDAEYLMMAAGGVSMYWLILSSDETYFEIASKFMPLAFSAITSDSVVVRKTETGTVLLFNEGESAHD